MALRTRRPSFLSNRIAQATPVSPAAAVRETRQARAVIVFMGRSPIFQCGASAYSALSTCVNNLLTFNDKGTVSIM